MRSWSAFFPIAIAFIVINLLVTQDGGQNARSRLLAMRTFAETATFRMDSHLRVTDDWAKSPNGHYYSNKAPGPMILGMPVFFFFDKLHIMAENGFRDERGLRTDPGYFQATAVSILMQAVPFALLSLACVAWLALAGVSLGGQVYFLLAALFANTAVLFMNSYFGHGFSALLQLAGLYFLLLRRYSWSGLFFSFALLSDYGFAVQIPALLAALLLLRSKRGELFALMLGGLPGGLLWIAYHWSIFGSPVAIASRFQNPIFLEATGQPLLWGMISLPQPEYLWELTLGASRGLVLSQPWIFWLIPVLGWSFYRGRGNRVLGAVSAFCFLSLAGLLVMNASFNGWHGGGTAGPRYLSGVLPCFALLAAFAWDLSNRPLKILGAALLAVGLLFRALVYGGTLLAPNVPLWGFYLAEWQTRSTPILRFFIFFAVLGLGAYFCRRRLGQKSKLLVARIGDFS